MRPRYMIPPLIQRSGEDQGKSCVGPSLSYPFLHASTAGLMRKRCNATRCRRGIW